MGLMMGISGELIKFLSGGSDCVGYSCANETVSLLFFFYTLKIGTKHRKKNINVKSVSSK
jgi:hypothetical protein